MAVTPRVSIVLPVFNAEAYLAEAVESLLAQSLADFELIAIDDGSTDHSQRILEGFAARDSRVLVISRENRGLAATLNEGITIATGALVAIMNADDIALTERLAKQTAFLDRHPHVAAVGSQTMFFADHAVAAPATSLPQSPQAVRAFLAKASPLAHPAVMFRRQAAVAAGLYRPQIAPAEDYDLWLRLADRADLANLPEVLLRYRLHAGQMTACRDEAFAIGTLVAQAASRERLAGRPDPVDGAASLSPELLARLGISEKDIAQQILEMALLRAETLLTVTGSVAQALGSLSGLEGYWVFRNRPRFLLACTRWLEARAALQQGRVLAAVPKFLAAMRADGSFAGRLTRAVIRRVISGPR
jgi:hypothetical protein